jgi:hypothetical protein
MVSEKALDARLMPEYVIPVEIEGGASQGNADLLIFRVRSLGFQQPVLFV